MEVNHHGSFGLNLYEMSLQHCYIAFYILACTMSSQVVSYSQLTEEKNVQPQFIDKNVCYAKIDVGSLANYMIALKGNDDGKPLP